MTASATSRIPRYVPDEPLPPYAFVPGKSPHPTRNPAGHSFGRVAKPPARFEPNKWAACRDYLYGVDLFNHGYYWEAHEAWESLWRACRPDEVQGAYLRALIRLAAAGVKARQGSLRGVGSHATAAAGLFRRVADELGPGRCMGLELDALCRFAEEVAAGRGLGDLNVSSQGGGVFVFVLQPE